MLGHKYNFEGICINYLRPCWNFAPKIMGIKWFLNSIFYSSIRCTSVRFDFSIFSIFSVHWHSLSKDHFTAYIKSQMEMRVGKHEFDKVSFIIEHLNPIQSLTSTHQILIYQYILYWLTTVSHLSCTWSYQCHILICLSLMKQSYKTWEEEL